MSEVVQQEPVIEVPMGASQQLKEIYNQINKDITHTKNQEPVWNKHTVNLWIKIKPLFESMITRIDELETSVLRSEPSEHPDTGEDGNHIPASSGREGEK